MMEPKNSVPVIVIGGGLAGLIASICLRNEGIDCILFEKRQYPFNRVCGEYISNEVKPFLTKLGIYPSQFYPSDLKQFQLTDIKGNKASIDLPLGGFGISRYQLDNFLYQKALSLGVQVKTSTEVESIHFENDSFLLQSKSGEEYVADFVIAAYGKRAKLDKQLNRNFIKRQSPFLGVKYHAYVDFPEDVIGLYNFDGGYCGVSRVEGKLVNICYLSERSNLKKHGNIEAMEKEVLHKNPTLKSILENAVLLRDKPEVINEISFRKKDCVENHMLMAGDTAGLITPLCGNGMAMAIHAGYIASEKITKFYKGDLKSRKQVEQEYKKAWTKHFAKRLWVGRNTQHLFGKQWKAFIAVKFIQSFLRMAKKLIRQTHGKPF